jgi:hypothetical protein
MKRTLPIATTTLRRLGGACALLSLLLALSATPASAQRMPGSIGIGGQIGDPSGLTLKVYNPGRMSYDFLAAWDLDDFFFVNAHGLFSRHVGNRDDLHFFYGPGLFLGFRDRARDEDDDVVAGISGTFGLGYVFDRFELYGQLTPRLSVVPGTDGDLGGGLGFRFYF